MLNLLDILRLKMACRRAGVMRVKAETVRNDKEIVLTLQPRVTANEIMQLLSKNSNWRIVSQTLRLSQAFYEREEGVEWLPRLTAEIGLLAKKTPKK